MRRVLLLAVVAAAVAAVVAGSAAATNECRGLTVCIRVAGPWVVVPNELAVPRSQVQYQLSCPRGTIVGGLDAELSTPNIDVGFLGALGAPVNPGITTDRNAVFLGTYVGATAAAPTFRPHLGCMPAQGGGVRVPTSAAVFPPGKPTVRRIKTVTVQPGGTRTVTQACAAGERLVGATHAFGVYATTPPGSGQLATLRATRRIHGDAVSVRASAGAELTGLRTVIQVDAICAGGR